MRRTVKPADLLPGDRIQQRPVLTVVRVDRVEAEWVRYIVTRPRDGVDIYASVHPNTDLFVERAEFDLDDGEATPEPWANDMRVKGGAVR